MKKLIIAIGVLLGLSISLINVHVIKSDPRARTECWSGAVGVSFGCFTRDYEPDWGDPIGKIIALTQAYAGTVREAVDDDTQVFQLKAGETFCTSAPLQSADDFVVTWIEKNALSTERELPVPALSEGSGSCRATSSGRLPIYLEVPVGAREGTSFYPVVRDESGAELSIKPVRVVVVE